MFGAAHHSVDFIHNGIEAVAGLCQSMVSLRFSYVHRLVLVSTQEVRINPINKQEQMKKLLLFLMLLSATNAFAQDVIVKKDGSTIVSKVIEITSTEVKYKKFSNLNGPTYTIAKTELQAINYEDGEKEMFTQNTFDSTAFTPNKTNNQYVSDTTLIRMAGGISLEQKQMRKIKRLRTYGWTVGAIISIPGTVFLVWGIAVDEGEALIAGGAAMMAAGIATTSGCLIRAHKLHQRSQYFVQSAPLYQQKITFNNGTFLATGVDVIRDNQLNNNPTLGLGVRYNF